MTVGESDDAVGSPWAGDVPVPAAPSEFAWSRPGELEVASLDAASTGRDGDTSVAAESTLGAEGAAEQPALLALVLSSERRRWAAGLVAAATLLVLGWLVIGRVDGNGSLDAVGAVTPVESTDEVMADDPLLAVDESVGADPGDDAGSGSGSGDRLDGPPEWREDVVELPQVLLNSSIPYEVVALTSTGDYVEVSIPSGDVDTIEVGQGIDGRVVAGDTATLFVSYRSTQGGRLLRDGEPPLELSLPSNISIAQVIDAGHEFAGMAYRNGEQSLFRVLADGGVVTTSFDDADIGFWHGRFAPDGSALVDEAGGVYRDGPDGYERISTGVLIATSPHHVLVQECDGAMVCGYATIEFGTGERVEAVIADGLLGSFGFGSAHVSPNGRWLRVVAARGDSSDEVIMDLTTGERTDIDFIDLGPGGRVWAADSSGFFRESLSVGFEFYVVATGETITFGEELGRMVSFDIRPTVESEPGPARASSTTGLELIALTAAGDVAEIDVDSGAVVITDGPGIDSDAPVTVLPDAAGATFISYDNVASMRFIAAERSALEVVGASPSGPMWPGPTPGSFWQTEDSDDTAALALVDAQGNGLGASIEVDADGSFGLVGSDGGGGVVIEPALGGVFALDGSKPPERITSGELLALNAAVAYVRECDGALQCGVFAVDRATGNRTRVDNTGFSRTGDIGSRGVPSGQNVSPDGTIALVRDSGDPTRCLMIDTAAGRDSWTAVPCVDIASPIIWTPDSAYVLWLADGHATIYERSTRSVRLVDTVELSAIAAAPTDDTEPET